MVAEDLKFCIENGISNYKTSINLPEGQERQLLKKLQVTCGVSTDTDGSQRSEIEVKSEGGWLRKRDFCEIVDECSSQY